MYFDIAFEVYLLVPLAFQYLLFLTLWMPLNIFIITYIHILHNNNFPCSATLS